MKHLFTPILVVALTMQVQGQASLTLTESDGTPISGTSVTVSGSAGDYTLGKALNVVLNGTSGEINVKRYETGVLPGSMNYFCWYECYSPELAGDSPVYTAPDPVELISNEPFAGFHAYYRPMGLVGTSCFRYVWYSESNAVDSVYLDICVESAPVGISELSAAAVRLDVAPNPSIGDVTFSCDQASGAQRQLVLHNALGERVSTIAVNGAQRKVSFGAGELTSGVWFASLESAGRTLATRRFVISGH